jgi:hypothetical protein
MAWPTRENLPLTLLTVLQQCCALNLLCILLQDSCSINVMLLAATSCRTIEVLWFKCAHRLDLQTVQHARWQPQISRHTGTPTAQCCSPAACTVAAYLAPFICAHHHLASGSTAEYVGAQLHVLLIQPEPAQQSRAAAATAAAQSKAQPTT